MTREVAPPPVRRSLQGDLDGSSTRELATLAGWQLPVPWSAYRAAAGTWHLRCCQQRSVRTASAAGWLKWHRARRSRKCKAELPETLRAMRMQLALRTAVSLPQMAHQLNVQPHQPVLWAVRPSCRFRAATAPASLRLTVTVVA